MKFAHLVQFLKEKNSTPHRIIAVYCVYTIQCSNHCISYTGSVELKSKIDETENVEFEWRTPNVHR